jgi:hypothetical protein
MVVPKKDFNTGKGNNTSMEHHIVSKTSYGSTFEAEVYFDSKTSVYRWVSNDRIPPKDAIVEYGIDQLPKYNGTLTSVMRDIEVKQAIEEYRAAMKDYTPNDVTRAEMRNAFGEGAEVVNVITGKVIKL